MTTLSFTSTDQKVFIAGSALRGLPNGPATIIVLYRQMSTGDRDLCGLTDGSATPSAWYHTLATGGAGTGGTAGSLFDDDGLVGITGPAVSQAVNDWRWLAVDWGTGTATEAFHVRDHTTGGSWTHSTSSGNNGGLRAGPGTGWFHVGYSGDQPNGTVEQALVAVWAGTRFSNADYGIWTKTSDLYQHPLGVPTFITELNTFTPFDLTGASTYSSANSSGSSFTGGNPPTWTFDGTGATPQMSMPILFGLALAPIGPQQLGIQPFTSDDIPTVTPVTDSDTGTGTDGGTVSETGAGSDTGSGSDSGAVSITLSDADSGAGTDSGAVAVPLSGADTGIGTDTGAASVTLTGSDAGTGTDAGAVGQTPVIGTDTGLVTDTGTVSVTLTGSDTAAGTDAGTIDDISGATLVSSSDSGLATDAGTVVDLTPPVTPPDTGLGGGVWTGEEDVSEVDLHRKTGADFAVGLEAGHVEDLTPPVELPPFPRLTRRGKRIADRDAGLADDTAARIFVAITAADSGVGTDAAMFDDVGAEAEDEQFVLKHLLGLDL